MGFFDRCERALSPYTTLAEMDGWSRLYGTCESALPQDDLLRVLARCTNDGDSMIMRTVASRLSNKDIEAVASYIQGLR